MRCGGAWCQTFDSLAVESSFLEVAAQGISQRDGTLEHHVSGTRVTSTLSQSLDRHRTRGEATVRVCVDTNTNMEEKAEAYSAPLLAKIPADGRLLPASSVPGPAGFPPVKVRATAADLLPSRSLLHQVRTQA